MTTVTTDTLVQEARDLLAFHGDLPVLGIVDHWRDTHGDAVDGDNAVWAGGDKQVLIAADLTPDATAALTQLLDEQHVHSLATELEAFLVHGFDGTSMYAMPYFTGDAEPGTTWMSATIHNRPKETP